jgi:hypothetical protein
MGFEDKQFQDLHHSHVVNVTISGRPNRDTAIGHDDIINLQIALNTTNDVSEFLVVIK